jgi:hypothetical protein
VNGFKAIATALHGSGGAERLSLTLAKVFNEGGYSAHLAVMGLLQAPIGFHSHPSKDVPYDPTQPHWHSSSFLLSVGALSLLLVGYSVWRLTGGKGLRRIWREFKARRRSK